MQKTQKKSKGDTKLPENLAMAYRGLLIAKKEEGGSTSLSLNILPLTTGDTKKHYFPSGVYVDNTNSSYTPICYNVRIKTDWELLLKVYEEHDENKDLLKEIQTMLDKIMKYISDNKGLLSLVSDGDLKRVLENPFEEHKGEDWEKVKCALVEKLMKDSSVDPYPTSQIKETIEQMVVVNAFKDLHEKFSNKLDEIPKARFADSEKYALIDFLTKRSEEVLLHGANILATTLHLHSHFDVCEHCSKTIRWFGRKHNIMPFISSLVPLPKAGKSEVRPEVGFDEDYHTTIDFLLFYAKGVYPQYRVPHHSFQQKRLTELDSFARA